MNGYKWKTNQDLKKIIENRYMNANAVSQSTIRFPVVNLFPKAPVWPWAALWHNTSFLKPNHIWYHWKSIELEMNKMFLVWTFIFQNIKKKFKDWYFVDSFITKLFRIEHRRNQATNLVTWCLKLIKIVHRANGPHSNYISN